MATVSDRAKKALQNKAKEADAPYGALKEIYLKGMGAAATSGRRPGVTPQQWGMARVNSVLTGGKARNVDKVQWDKIKKHRAKKKK